MRRALALSALFGLFVTGIGCKHVGGKCDCTNDPGDSVLPTPNNPYFPTSAITSGPVGPAVDTGATTPTTPATPPTTAPNTLPKSNM